MLGEEFRAGVGVYLIGEVTRGIMTNLNGKKPYAGFGIETRSVFAPHRKPMRQTPVPITRAKFSVPLAQRPPYKFFPIRDAASSLLTIFLVALHLSGNVEHVLIRIFLCWYRSGRYYVLSSLSRSLMCSLYFIQPSSKKAFRLAIFLSLVL